MSIKRLFFLLCILSLCSCVSSRLIEKKEYAQTISELKSENFEKAIEVFPKKEKDHFITVLEKAYLRLLSSNKMKQEEVDQLVKLAGQIEAKDVIYLSNEVQNLFYIETDEGYFPAEHELYWMHLVLGFHYLKNLEPDLARIHAQKISELFSRINNKGEKYFDDAALRILAATLWLGVNEWDRAQVDIRRAYELQPSLIFLKETLASNAPPREWAVVLRGTGYQASFESNKLESLFSGSEGIKFKSFLIADKKPLDLSFIGSSESWYQRHVYRNYEIKNVIDKSRYMTRMFKSELEYGSLNALTTAATGVVITTGVALGIGIVGSGIYLLSQVGGSSSGEAAGYIVAFGFLVGSEIYNAGVNFYDKTTTRLKKDKTEYQDVSRFYRYVRFIPDEIYLKPSLENKTYERYLFATIPAKKTQIKMYFLNQ
jgi:tetratricopeptide (TPR) repeat protein